jgi:YD repeat-containing protein
VIPKDPAIAERVDDQGRLVAQWWPLQWTSPLLDETPRPISLFDLAELRAVVDTDRVAAGLAPVRWVGRSDDDPTFVAGLTPIRAVHFTQLRWAIDELWQIAELGPIPEFRAGPIVPGTRVVSLRDPLDLRSWVEIYEAARPDLAARVVWRYQAEPQPWLASSVELTMSPAFEVWDAVGHSLVGIALQGGSSWERRRIDTTWYETTLTGWDSLIKVPVASVSALPHPNPPLGGGGSGLTPSPSKGRVGVGERATPPIDLHAGVPFVTWEPNLSDLDPAWQIDRDALGRAIRILDGDAVIARLAYDGLGRLRKVVDQATTHILGPGISLDARSGVGGPEAGSA